LGSHWSEKCPFKKQFKIMRTIQGNKMIPKDGCQL
jgi:hypothetical protein